jgi:hypothetical protein
MKNFEEDFGNTLRINQSGLDPIEINDMLLRLQQLSVTDRLGLLDRETLEALEAVPA